ncbi:hypothetical protein SMB34_05185 [Thalassospira permensis NBRC 106175]|uniref:Uncharacterized protein n=1 Tax=Thalassospira permensis NBRC 106175 TaxID=1353532 RepID=A0ABR4TMQ3_9PROT|nr:hypothetical protein SMB34_05185 [Thalassospira permensis NBRC 106175]
MVLVPFLEDVPQAGIPGAGLSQFYRQFDKISL